MKLQDMCLRSIAHNWEFYKEYEKNNLADIPAALRILLLSNIALYGPEEGVGFEGLRDLLLHPAETIDVDTREDNDGFHRLDLSGSIGRSVSLKQLLGLLQKPAQPAEDESEESWEESISQPLGAIVPNLTHLSLSHPPPTVSWKNLLSLAKHLPTLTHLSLAYWPVPSLAPNSKTAVVSSRFSGDIQYGSTNYYSHTLDDDFREAALVLKIFASHTYSLEYLDITGCSEWWAAFSWYDFSAPGSNLDLVKYWLKLNTLRFYSGLVLTPESDFADVSRYNETYKQTIILDGEASFRSRLGPMRKKRKVYISTQKDDRHIYDGFWRGNDPEDKKKRHVMDSLKGLEEVSALNLNERLGRRVEHPEVEEATPLLWD
jgi:hypothetical protein